MKASPQIFLLVVFLFAIKIALAQPGALDPTFGNGGIVDLHPNFTVDQARDIALTTDGKILLLSSYYSIGNYLIRLKGNGTLDYSYGEQGKLSIIPNDVTSTALEVDSINRIMLLTEYGGTSGPGTAVYRFLQNGAKDSSFGLNGKTITTMTKVNRAMIIQQDGKIVVGGQDVMLRATIERLNIDGTVDTSFNSDGKVVFSSFPNSYVFALRQQPDGKLLATGTADGKMFVARFNASGNLDFTFNTTGYITFSSDDLMAGQDVQVMPDGKILVVGHGETSADSRMLCWRLLANGTPDNTFGSNGIDTLYNGIENNFAWFAFANEDSTAIVGGEIFNGLVYQPVLYRLLNDGSLDNGFGMNGIAGKTFDCGKSIQVNAARDDDGKILYCGTAFENGNTMVAATKLQTDGLIDSSFASSGLFEVATVDSVHSNCVLQDFTVLSNKKILCAGVSSQQLIYFRLDSLGTLDSSYGVNGYYVPNQKVTTQQIIFACDSTNVYAAQNCFSQQLGDEDLIDLETPIGVILQKIDAYGNPDSTFGAGGILRVDFPDQNADAVYCNDLKLQGDSKLLLAQQRVHDFGFPYGTESNIFLFRFKADGKIDSTFANSGIQSFDEPEGASPLLITVRNDGKINCLYGFSIYPEGYIGISRLLSDGSFDPSFGVDGSLSFLSDAWQIHQWLLQSDQKMLLVLLFASGPYYKAMFGFNEDGTSDSLFAGNGLLDLSFLNYGNLGCQLQTDDKILACNGILGSDNTTIVRYLNGIPDPSFGSNGIASFEGPLPGGDRLHLIRLQPDEKILIGTETTVNYSGDFYLVRLLGGIGTSISSADVEPTLVMHPNPTTDCLIVTDKSLCNEQATVVIRGISGRALNVPWEKFGNDQLIVQSENLSPGIYFLTLQTPKTIKTAKFIRQ